MNALTYQAQRVIDHNNKIQAALEGAKNGSEAHIAIVLVHVEAQQIYIERLEAQLAAEQQKNKKRFWKK